MTVANYNLLISCVSLSLKMEEEEGFEPPRALTPLSVFKTDPFSQTWVFLHIQRFIIYNIFSLLSISLKIIVCVNFFSVMLLYQYFEHSIFVHLFPTTALSLAGLDFS